MEKQRLVQFGAGNIGRSFIGRVFGTEGWEVVFVDINRELIDKLNRERSYRIIVKKNAVADREIAVPNVRGIIGSDLEAVEREIVAADLIATSVGKNVLPRIAPALAQGLAARFSSGASARPINIILAENIHDGAAFVAGELRKNLPAGFQLEGRIGLIETSIGKMVPIMPQEIVREDPSIVFSEAYNTLILDAAAFLGPIPPIADIEAVDPIAAYVDRKLCIHNLGHAAVSYFGNEALPEAVFLYEVLADPTQNSRVRRAMGQAAEALLAEYPTVFSRQALADHIDDLIERFQNVALGDTIYRVGRDLPRKLYRDDRVLGAARLCVRHSLPHDEILAVFRAGTRFLAVDEAGEPFGEDLRFRNELAGKGLEQVLTGLCGLAPADPGDAAIMEELLAR